MKKEGISKIWRTLAIIFIILFVLETIFVVWVFSLGSKAIKNENICAINICSDEKYTSYFYDDYDEICYCYEGDEVTYQQVLTGKTIDTP